MFDNPQQEVKKMSKKLRPIKMSDEDFELFYKEIYAEFGPKDVPPVTVNPQVEEPAEEMVAEPVEEIVEESVVEEIPQRIAEEPVAAPLEEAVQENTAKAAAVIRNVREDEVINDDTDGVKIKKKEKGVAGLVVTLCLECLAIVGVVAYWLFYIL